MGGIIGFPELLSYRLINMNTKINITGKRAAFLFIMLVASTIVINLVPGTLDELGFTAVLIYFFPIVAAIGYFYGQDSKNTAND